MIIWLIGLSGSGKTTIGRKLYDRIKKKHVNTVFLDGDLIREVMGNDLGHTVGDRKRNADRICRMCKMFDTQDINVVCCILSLFRESQDWNRKNYKKYFEIYIEASTDTLKKRKEEFYNKALSGQVKDVVGVDIEFRPPKNPDLTINNDGKLNEIDAKVKEIIEKLPEF
jgi:adenylylsulfate kinase